MHCVLTRSLYQTYSDSGVSLNLIDYIESGDIMLLDTTIPESNSDSTIIEVSENRLSPLDKFDENIVVSLQHIGSEIEPGDDIRIRYCGENIVRFVDGLRKCIFVTEGKDIIAGSKPVNTDFIFELPAANASGMVTVTFRMMVDENGAKYWLVEANKDALEIRYTYYRGVFE